MDEILQKFAQYRTTYSIVARAHHVAATRYARYNHYLGVPVVILTATLGTTIFATINQSPNIEWKILAGLITLLAAVLAAIQTTLRFNEKAERHKLIGTRYSAIKRRCDFLVLKYRGNIDNGTEALKALDELLKDIETLSSDAPTVDNKDYDAAESEYKKALDEGLEPKYGLWHRGFPPKPIKRGE